MVPMNVELAPRVVAAAGAQKALQADAPFVAKTMELEEVSRAPVDRKIYIPVPFRVMVAPPSIDAAPLIQ
jgi:hypothetical protein